MCKYSICIQLPMYKYIYIDTTDGNEPATSNPK